MPINNRFRRSLADTPNLQEIAKRPDIQQDRLVYMH